MTWAAQVRHVFTKDVRQARWLLLGYLVIVALAMARALGWPGTSNSVFEIGMYAVVLTGMFLIAHCVQADSPVRSDAFWASRPLQATALLVAKLLLAAVAVALPALVAQFAAMRDNGVTVAAATPLSLHSAWLYAGWLLIAAMLAAVTRDLRGFTTALVVSFIALMVTSALVDGLWQVQSRLGRLVPVVGATLGIGGAVIVLSLLYASRRMSPWVWIGVAVAIAGTAVAVITPAMPTTRTDAAGPLTVPPGVSVRVALQESAQEAALAVTIDGVRASAYTTVLEAPAVVLRVRDGVPTRLLFNNERLDLSWASLPIGRDVRVIGYPDMPGSYTRTISLTPSQRDALRRGILGATLEGSLTTREPRAVVTVPFRTGAVARHDGTRIDILSTFRDGRDSLATVRRAAIRDESGGLALMAGSDPAGETPRHVLVNPDRREAVTVTDGMTSATSDGVVIPGAWLYATTSTLRAVPRVNDPATDERWLAQSRLVVLDWLPRQQSWVHVDAIVVP